MGPLQNSISPNPTQSLVGAGQQSLEGYNGSGTQFSNAQMQDGQRLLAGKPLSNNQIGSPLNQYDNAQQPNGANMVSKSISKSLFLLNALSSHFPRGLRAQY